jgi:phosphoinositide-3-kinase regulatory subunit 4
VVLEGEERHIRQLLEKKRYDLAQPMIPELGPRVKILSNSYSSQLNQEEWSPKGIMVAQFPEHRGAVNAIELAPDHKFFASCADDGLVKIWDTDRLLTNVTNRARLTYSGHGSSPVKAIAFIEGRHSIVSASRDGKIHIMRVEYISRHQQSTKYTACKFMNQLQLVDDYATHVSHYETEYSSLLVYASKKGLLTAVDIRNMKEAWSFQPPPHYGEITSMVMDKHHNWLLSGTHRGVLSLWDVRFGVNTQSWQHPSASAITKLSLYPIPLQGKPHANIAKTVCMAVENRIQEISVWDVDSKECHQVWCALGEDSMDSQTSLDQLYGNGVRALPPPTTWDMLEHAMSHAHSYTLPKRPQRRVFALNTLTKSMVSGGTDRMVRYHDISFPEKSFVISGLGANPSPVYK